MLLNQKIIVILPAYNAEKTLQKTYNEIPFDIVDDVILTDDFSSDYTLAIAKKLNINHLIVHKHNKGYGANQKSCYQKAIDLKADIIVMLHPDYQYNPKLIYAMCSLVANKIYKVVLGSRILGGKSLNGGMPLYKYVANRFLTLVQNLLMGQKLSEYHTGYRCFRTETLKQIPFQNNSDDFIFDNQLLAQLCYKSVTIGEISCPANYEPGCSSINFTKSLKYGFVEIKNLPSFIPLLLLCVIYIYQAQHFAIHDFSNYYFGAYFFGEGQFTADIYFPHLFNQMIADLGFQNIFANYAPNTPLLSIFFYPFTLINLQTAKLVFNIISVSLFLYSLIRLTNFYQINDLYILLLPILFYLPIKNDLLFGQLYMLLFFLSAEGFLSYKKKQFIKMAVYWSFAVALKVFPFVFFFFLLFKKQWKPMIIMAVFCFGLLIVSVIVYGFDLWKFYFTEVLQRAARGEIAGAFVDNYQSIFMFLRRVLVYDSLENPNALFNIPKLFLACIFAIKTFLFVLAYYISKNTTKEIYLFSYWIIAGFLISPYGSTYAFLFFIFPFLALVKQQISVRKKLILIFLIGLVSNIHLSYFSDWQFPFSYMRFLILILFSTAFISLARSWINWQFSLFVVFISIGIKLVTNQSVTSNFTYFTKETIPLLTYDYCIDQNRLTYYYWNNNGINKNTLSQKIERFDSLKVDLYKHQIFVDNKQITFDQSNKLKPRLLKDGSVVFLSDKNRGIGFYNLLKLQLKK